MYSFEDNGEYVFDVAWSPIHPALFTTVDGSGRIDLWNLNQDTEVPTCTTYVDGNPALNRVSWTNSGQQITVGDDMGKVWIYDVGEVILYFIILIFAYYYYNFKSGKVPTRNVGNMRSS